MIQKFLTMLVVLMMLIPSVIAAPNENANLKAGLKIVDQSKGTMKEIKDDKVKGVKSSSVDIIVEEKGKNSIKLKDSKPSKNTKEHKKVKVSIPASELQKIDDPSKDGVFGVLEIADDGTIIGQRTATTAQLVAGDDFTFSKVEINGFSGYREETFAGAKSGDILNIVDVSGDYIQTVSADGVIPEYVPGIPSGYEAYWDFENVAGTVVPDVSGNGHTGDVYGNAYYPVDGVNGHGYTTNTTGYINLGLGEEFNLSQYTLSVKLKHSRGVLKGSSVFSRVPTSKYNWQVDITTVGKARCSIWDGTYINQTNTTTAMVPGRWETITVTRNTTSEKLNLFRDAYETKTITAPVMNNVGPATTKLTAHANYTLDSAVIYPYPMNNTSDIHALAAGGYGIFLNPDGYPVNYNLSGGAEKIISDGGTCATIEYIDTSGVTRNVTIRTYYTEDTTITTQSSDDFFHNISIVHNAGNTVPNGTIIMPIAPLYTGTAVLDSNNTNAVLTQNRTHFTIYTGALTATNWFGYNVSVPNNADHGMWLDRLMQWVSGVGWNFVGDAPADYTDDLSDEITVTVS